MRIIRNNLLTLAIVVATTVQGQQKKMLTPADYHLWGTLIMDQLSAGGKWVSCHMKYTDADTLIVKSTQDGRRYNFARGTNSRFFGDSVFACIVPGKGLVLLNTESAQQQVIPEVSDYAFSKQGEWLVLVRKDKDENILELRRPDGMEVKQVIGCQSFVFSPKGDAVICNVMKQKKHNIVLVDLEKQPFEVPIVESASPFGTVVWNVPGTAAAFIREADSINGNPALVYLYDTKKRKLFSYSENSKNFPKGMRIDSEGQPLNVSDDGQRVFFGVRVRGSENYEDQGVQVWNGNDAYIYPQRRNIGNGDVIAKLSVWWPATGRFYQITDNSLPSVMLNGDQRHAITYNKMVGKPFTTYEPDVDLYITDLETGKKSPFLKGHSTIGNFALASPGGKYVTYFSEGDWWAYNINKAQHINITAGLGMTDIENDEAGEKGAYGLAGWTSDDHSLLVYDANDIWEIGTDGSRKRLTNGKENGIRFRMAPNIYLPWDVPNYDGRTSYAFDLKSNILLQAKNTGNASSGYYSYSRKTGLVRIFFDNCATDQAAVSSSGDQIVFRNQRFDLSPELTFADALESKVVLQSNTQQDKFAWGTAKIIRYKNSLGKSLKGVLYFPAGYVTGKKYPMVVEIYERFSGTIHYYSNPSLYNTSGFNVSHLLNSGYFVLCPDIVYKLGDPGLSATDCVIAATQAVIDMEVVDKDRIGLMGHSFGGYETNFIITQTDMFAAAVSGAGVSDMTSFYLTVGWNSGRPDMWRSESQQWRMGKSFFDDREGYDRNSPIMHVEKVQTPLLLWSGEQDIQINWDQSIEYYLALRRLRKPNIMLVYPGNGHSLSVKADQKDLTCRISEWFDYHLKGGNPKPWISNGLRP